MATTLSQRWTLSDIHHAGSFAQAAQTLQTASIDDVVAMAVFAILSAVYLMRGTLWDKPDPYAYKMYERPQQKMGAKTITATTRDVTERMQQVVSTTFLTNTYFAISDRYLGHRHRYILGFTVWNSGEIR